ncbi:MAG TPA: 2-dehydropantoate 2-reductase [Spirochaetia bacterium]|nr:2-dehydropantoate 2-reductase [Spirochaetia bacterium]
MKICIIGSGAMGSLFGGRLSLAGFDTTLYDIFREHVERVASDGLAIEDAATGEVTVARPSASTDPGAARGADVLIIFVKSTSTEQAAAAFAPLAGPNTVVLTLQNGLGNEAVISSHFGPGRTAAGVTSQGATFLGPGRIRHAGRGPTHICMSDGRNEKLAPLCAALQKAGFETHVSADVASLVWSKLVINVGINALTAITGQVNGRLVESEETRAIMADLVHEAVVVARARGIALTPEDPLPGVYDVARRTGANRSSMLQDFDRHRPSEIEVMNGAVVREAARAGIAVPVNETITRVIRALEASWAGKGGA